jgi:hypothetical protein
MKRHQEGRAEAQIFIRHAPPTDGSRLDTHA